MKSYINYNLETSLKSSDDPLLKTPEYHKVMEVLQSLKSTQLIKTFHGNCIAASEIMQSMLAQVGINSKMVEVQLLITRHGPKEEFLFVGFDNNEFSGQVDTHMVVITQTPQPMIIDLSIAHVLPADRCYLVESVNPTENSLSQHRIENLTLVYQQKRIVRFPSIHQKNLVERIIEDQAFRKQFVKLNWLVFLGLSLAGVNFILNSILIVLKIIYP